VLFRSRDLDQLLYAQGEPFATLSIYAQFKVFELAKKNGIKVTLDGQGADELLAGYHGFPEARMRSLVESKDFFRLISLISAWRRWPGRSMRGLAGVVLADATPTLRRSSKFISALSAINLIGDHSLEFFESNTLKIASSLTNVRDTSEEFHGRRLTEALYLALGPKRLSTLLRFADRNSMFSSIESRVPFLNKKLVEFTLALPEQYLLSSKGQTKYILREAMRGLVPHEILQRRDKVGFEASSTSWGAGSNSLNVLSKNLDGIPLLNSKQCTAAIKDVVDGKRQLDSNLWRVINFSKWYQMEGLTD
jgi:asparagine synthase (glutamine-hydrolysing)